MPRDQDGDGFTWICRADMVTPASAFTLNLSTPKKLGPTGTQSDPAC